MTKEIFLFLIILTGPQRVDGIKINTDEGTLILEPRRTSFSKKKSPGKKQQSNLPSANKVDFTEMLNDWLFDKPSNV